MSRWTVLSLAALMFLGSGCAAVSDYLGRPMGDYRADRELRAYYLNKTAITRGDLTDAATGEVVFQAGTPVQVTDIEYRPNRYPKSTGHVEIMGPDGKELKLGFESYFEEHFILEINQVLAFDTPAPSGSLPWRVGVAEERAARLAVLKAEYAGVPLWLVRDTACMQGSKRPVLPVGTQVTLEDGSVLIGEGLEGDRIVPKIVFTDGQGSRITMRLDAPRRTYAEWYDQMGRIVTTGQRTVAPESLPAGASREAVLEAWGAPDRRRGMLTNDGVREEWTYLLREQTIVFVDGKLRRGK